MSSTRGFAGKVTAPARFAVQYLRDSYRELRLVRWPTREQSIQYTTTVVVSVLVVTGLTSALDFGLAKLIEQLIAWSQHA